MNAFDALGLPQRLTLTAENIEAAWHEASKAHHPDAGGDEQRFATLRQARATLANPATRLAHWLELHGQKPDPRGTIATEIMDLFAPVGEIMQQADALARRRAATTTALGLAMLEGESLRVREGVEETINRITAAIDCQCAPFAQWESGGPTTDDAQALTLRNLQFLEKWKRSLMAAYARLA